MNGRDSASASAMPNVVLPLADTPCYIRPTNYKFVFVLSELRARYVRSVTPTMTTMIIPLVPVENEARSNLFSSVDDMGIRERIKHYKAMQMSVLPFKCADSDTVNQMANKRILKRGLAFYVIVLGGRNRLWAEIIPALYVMNQRSVPRLPSCVKSQMPSNESAPNNTSSQLSTKFIL
jgi:hypothetical protein